MQCDRTIQRPQEQIQTLAQQQSDWQRKDVILRSPSSRDSEVLPAVTGKGQTEKSASRPYGERMRSHRKLRG
jgi:hypothetical protein